MIYKYTQTPIQEDEWHKETEKKPELALMIRRNYNRRMLKELEMRLKQGNIIASVYGQTNTGKSLSSISFASCCLKIIQKHLKRKCRQEPYWHFDPERMLDSIKHDPESDTIHILDEQRRDYGIGSGRLEADMHNVEEMIRKKRISFIFNSPTLKPHINHFILKTYGIDYEKGIAKLIMFSPDQHMLGYITLKRIPEELEKSYDKNKDEFLEKVAKREITLKSSLEEKGKELMHDNDYIQFCRNDTMRLAYITKKYSLTETEAKMVRAWFNFHYFKTLNTKENNNKQDKQVWLKKRHN